MNEKIFDSELAVTGDQTILSRDFLVAENDNKEIIGYSGFLKSSKRDSWDLEVNMLPEYFKSDFMVELFESIIDLANQQNAPDLRFVIIKYAFENSPLHNKFKEMGLEPVIYDFWMYLDNIGSLPQLEAPPDITFQKQKKVNDLTSYIAVRNDAFSKHFDFRPHSEEELKLLLEDIWQEYDQEHWLAFDDDKLVGICSSTINPEFKKIGTVETLGVLHTYHQHGIGSYLLGNGIQSLGQKGCKRIELGVEATNEKALGLYKKFGFQQVKSRTFIWYTIK
jgi:mycothiol synthase